MAEIAFEYLAVALETVRGTGIAAPTHILPIEGTLKPAGDRYRPEEQRGTLVKRYRSKKVRQWSEFDGEGPLDLYAAPIIANMIVKGGVTTPTDPDPTNNPTVRLWTFLPTINADNLKSGTFWWGDPNVQIFRGVFGMIDEWTISADASGTDGSTQGVSGRTNFQEQVAAPALPAQLSAPLISPLDIEMFLNLKGGAEVEVTARFVSVEHTIEGAYSYKFNGQGPGSAKTYNRIGRGRRGLVTNVTLELLDTTQYDLFEADSEVKLRVRHNGPLISNGGGTDYYHYLEVETYGRLEVDDWGDLEGTNRTISFSLESEYDATLGADFQIKIQNDRATL